MLYHRGEKVVDLWGDYSDLTRRRAWEQDTLVLVFSTTKGMGAMALAVAHSQGLLEYDAPVARYWPEFAQNGKERVTVRQILSHQAGIPAIEPPLDVATLADLDRLAVLLARQRPEWIQSFRKKRPRTPCHSAERPRSGRAARGMRALRLRPHKSYPISHGSS